MYKSKLISILKTFTSKEIKHFEEFIYSKFNNKNRRCQQLFNILKPHHPEYKHHSLSKNIVSQQIPGLSVTMAHLLRLVEEFLITVRLEQYPFYKQHLLMKEMLQRRAYKHFKSIYNKVATEHTRLPQKGMNHYYAQYLFEQDFLDYIIDTQSRTRDIDIQQLANTFDLHYIINKLRLSCYLLNYSKILSVNYELPLLAEAARIAELPEFQSIPAVQMYYTALQMQRSPGDEAYFHTLQEHLQTHGHTLPEAELRDLYTSAVNYAIEKIKKGQTQYSTELFKLYNGLLQANLFYKGHLSPGRFKNVITLACQLGKITWAEKFLKKYKDDIAAPFRQNAEYFGWGSIYFYKKDYLTAQEYCHKADGLDVFFTTNLKLLLLKIYYETSETTPLNYAANAFKAFLRNNKELSTANQETYINAVNTLLSLYRIKSEPYRKGRKSLQTIKKELEQQDYSQKAWLEEKIAELEHINS